jgi:hypothetical protein
MTRQRAPKENDAPQRGSTRPRGQKESRTTSKDEPNGTTYKTISSPKTDISPIVAQVESVVAGIAHVAFALAEAAALERSAASARRATTALELARLALQLREDMTEEVVL